jgi:CheY-like chemotaxis protein
VLVNDLGMPEQDGYELIKEISEMESADHTAQDSRRRANSVC